MIEKIKIIYWWNILWTLQHTTCYLNKILKWIMSFETLETMTWNCHVCNRRDDVWYFMNLNWMLQKTEEIKNWKSSDVNQTLKDTTSDIMSTRIQCMIEIKSCISIQVTTSWIGWSMEETFCVFNTRNMARIGGNANIKKRLRMTTK